MMDGTYQRIGTMNISKLLSVTLVLGTLGTGITEAQTQADALKCRTEYNATVARANRVQDLDVRRNQLKGAKAQFIECMMSARAGRRVFFVPGPGENTELKYDLEAERNRRILAPTQAQLLGAVGEAAVMAAPSGGSRGGATAGESAAGSLLKHAANKEMGDKVNKTVEQELQGRKRD